VLLSELLGEGSLRLFIKDHFEEHGVWLQLFELEVENVFFGEGVSPDYVVSDHCDLVKLFSQQVSCVVLGSADQNPALRI